MLRWVQYNVWLTNSRSELIISWSEPIVTLSNEKITPPDIAEPDRSQTLQWTMPDASITNHVFAVVISVRFAPLVYSRLKIVRVTPCLDSDQIEGSLYWGWGWRLLSTIMNWLVDLTADGFHDSHLKYLVSMSWKKWAQ